MAVVGTATGLGGTIVAALGGMVHELSTEMSNLPTVTETWCDRCDFQMSIQMGQFSHSHGDRCTKRRCAGTLHIQSRPVTTEERAKVMKENEVFVAGAKTAKHLGSVAALSGGLMFLAGVAALVAWYGLTRHKQWGRLLSLVVIVPSLASVAVAGSAHVILLTVIAPVPVLFTTFALRKLLGADADLGQDDMAGRPSPDFPMPGH